MITWKHSGRGTRKAGAGPSRAGRGQRGLQTHRDLAGVLVADLLHLLTAVGCGQHSKELGPIGLRPHTTPPRRPEGRLRARPAPAPAPGAVGPTALNRGRGREAGDPARPCGLPTRGPAGRCLTSLG